ncbi:MAG: CinA family protein [Bacteroidota bacterium]
MTDRPTTQLAQRVLEAYREAALTLVAAESCTGGLLTVALTDIPRASAVVDRGFVVYSNAAKMEVLGVNPEWIVQHGAVSAEVAEAMAAGALEKSGADVALSITGIAGPSGGSVQKPVGLVYHCCHQRGQVPLIVRNLFTGDREEIRRKSVEKALELLLKVVV